MSSFDLFKNGACADIIVEKACPSGVKRIAKVVAADIEAVTGVCPRVIVQGECEGMTPAENVIYVKAEPTAAVCGKREVYELSLNDKPECENLKKRNVLRISGSDKRGIIYGLFAVSELIGVTPLVWWGDNKPAKKDEVVVNIEGGSVVSREPSIKYRGFFINDEWPAFGRWSEEKFGGFTAAAYEQVFLLLLRMKGNYLWPAMWSSTFSEDGPGLTSAELADELGVVMGASHHEPMCRAGEEWQHIYKQYGDDNTWSFISNKDAITEFWRDGIKRNKDFENIITIGMRGEADSKLLKEDATLADNINVVKSAIMTQHKLLREQFGEDLTNVTRMLAIYKEVEEYYYGSADCPGLRDWDELKDVIFMLCEDNWGNMRGLPEKIDLEKHKGGFGMYYHFDYHGAPISYEWVNCSRLTKTREQMCMAYEYGVRDLWIVNVGDLKGNEYPLTYFMELAYDYDKWSDIDAVERYVNQFLDRWSDGRVDKEVLKDIEKFVDGFTMWNSIRHPETMNPGIFSPDAFEEAARVNAAAAKLMELGTSIRLKLDKDMKDSFDSLFFYAGMASLNLIRMHTEAGLNAYFAAKSDKSANALAASVEEKIEQDKQYVKEFHELLDGKWNHMMDSAHTGFVTWNDEGWSYPEVVTVSDSPCCCLASKEVASADNGCGFASEKDIAVIEAEDMKLTEVSGEGFKVIPHLGRLGAAIKAYPVNKVFEDEKNLPAAEALINVKETGDYVAEFVFMARNPVVKGDPLRVRYSVNDGDKKVLNTLGEGFFTEWMCSMWGQGVLTGVHPMEVNLNLNEGCNTLKVYPYDPNAVLERIVIRPASLKMPESYLGPCRKL